MNCWPGCKALILRGASSGRVVQCLAFVGTRKKSPYQDLWSISEDICWLSTIHGVVKVEYRLAFCPDSYMMPIPDGDPDLVTERTKELVTTED